MRILALRGSRPKSRPAKDSAQAEEMSDFYHYGEAGGIFNRVFRTHQRGVSFMDRLFFSHVEIVFSLSMIIIHQVSP